MQGTVAELQERGLLDYVVLDADEPSSSDKDTIDSGRDMIESARDAMPSPTSRQFETTRDGTASSPDTPRGSRANRQKTVFTGQALPDQSAKDPRRLVKQEARARGQVKWRIYKVYLEASYVLAILAPTFY